MKIIDIHCHPDWGGYNYKKITTNMDEYNISKAWILPWQAPPDEYEPESNAHHAAIGPEGPIPFSCALKYYEKDPDRFILGYAPDPRCIESLDLLKSHISLYNVKVYAELKLRMMYDNPDAVRMFRFCGEAGLPVLVHIDYPIDKKRMYPRRDWWYGGGIEAFARTIRQCPETNFLGHAPGFWAHMSGDERYWNEYYPDGPVLPGGRIHELLDELPNLYCDLAGPSGYNSLARDTSHAKAFILRYQDRLLYGRDGYDNKLQELLFSLELPNTVLEKLFHKNAEKLIPALGSGT